MVSRRSLWASLLGVTLAGCTAVSQPASQSPETPSPAAAPSQVAVPAVSEENSPTPTAPDEEERVAPAPGASGNADVLFVRANLTGENVWTFTVTVAHPDTGWADYADGWDVVLPDGSVILPNEGDPFTRLLLHPHETEQPFTRSQSNIFIPSHVSEVTVRAHDLVAGFGGQEVVLDLTAVSGQNFEVNR